MTGCPQCGYVKPRKPGGRPKLYDVSQLTVGGQCVFTYRDADHRASIRGSIRVAGKKSGRSYGVRTVAPGIVEVTREA